MLREVKRTFIEDVTSHMQMIIRWGDNAEIVKLIDEAIRINSRHNVAFNLFDGVFVDTTIALPQDENHKSYKMGNILFENFLIYGSVFQFIAFCFQEGELQPYLPRDGEYRGEYCHDVEGLEVTRHGDNNTIGIGEWRRYIKTKYNILPPLLGESFLEFLECDIVVTGGIALSRH